MRKEDLKYLDEDKLAALAELKDMGEDIDAIIAKMPDPNKGEGVTAKGLEAATEAQSDPMRAVKYGLAKGVTLDWADEIAGKAGELQGQDYKAARDEYRRKEANALSQNKIIGTVSEMIGAAPYAFVPGGEGALGAIATGATMGAGAADEKEDIPINAALYGAGTGTMHGALSLMKKPFNNPDAIAARTIGATSRDFEKRGKFGAKEIAKELRDTGIFNPKKMRPEINVKKNGEIELKFLPDRKLYNPDLSDEENILNKTIEAIGKLKDVADNELSIANEKFPKIKKEHILYKDETGKYMIPEFNKAIERYATNSEGNYSELIKTADKKLKDAVSKLDNPRVFTVDDATNYINRIHDRISKLPDKRKEETLKGFILDNIQNVSNKKGLKNALKVLNSNEYDTNEKIKLAMQGVLESMADSTDDLIKSGSSLADISEVKSALQRKARDVYGKGVNESPVNKQFYEDIAAGLKGFLEEQVGSKKYSSANDKISKLMNIKDMLTGKVASQDATGLRLPIGVGATNTAIKGSAEAAKTPPFSNIRQSVGNKMMSIPSGVRGGMKRSLSVGPAAGLDVQQEKPIPEQLNEMKFPRNTQFFLENEDLVLAKVAQVAPEMLETVEQAYSSHRDELNNIIPMLIKTAPFLFENDRYDRFDGEIQDPEKRMLARKDIMRDDSLSNTEKVSLINNLNKTGVLNEYSYRGR